MKSEYSFTSEELKSLIVEAIGIYNANNKNVAKQIESLLENNHGVVVISDTTFQNIKREIRQDVRKKICGAKEAMYILDLKTTAFYEHLATLKCLVRPSSKKGKYVLSSVYDEAKRLNRK